MSPTMLAPNFSLEELTNDAGPGPIPLPVLANLRQLAQLAQHFRNAAGVPFDVTNGYDAPTVADPPGRVPSSQHKDGTALDFVPRGISLWEFYRRIEAAEKKGQLPDWGELIFYPFTLPKGKGGHGHVHLSLPTRRERREKMVRINEDENAGEKYALLTSSWLKKFPGAASAAGLLLGVVIALLVYFLLFAPEASRHA